MLSDLLHRFGLKNEPNIVFIRLTIFPVAEISSRFFRVYFLLYV